MSTGNKQTETEQCTIPSVSFSLLERLTASAINGIMANPNTMPTTQEHFNNIAEDAIRIAKSVITQLGNES
jgi:hypothetical protein